MECRCHERSAKAAGWRPCSLMAVFRVGSAADEVEDAAPPAHSSRWAPELLIERPCVLTACTSRIETISCLSQPGALDEAPERTAVCSTSPCCQHHEAVAAPFLGGLWINRRSSYVRIVTPARITFKQI